MHHTTDPAARLAAAHPGADGLLYLQAMAVAPQGRLTAEQYARYQRIVAGAIEIVESRER